MTGETEVLGENLPQCHSDSQKFHMTRPGIEPGLRRWEAGDYKLFFLIRLVGGGVQLGPVGTAATDWPIVACPGRL
jgi:hypothetical protein